MADLKLNHARELCTKAELELYQLSRGRELTSQDAPTLQKNRVRTRELRDKWRDLAKSQRRALQQKTGTRVVDKTERSSLKARLFQEMLTRFEKRRQEVLEKSSPASNGSAKGAKKTPTRTDRAAGHRAERATVRKTLRKKKNTTLGAAKSTDEGSSNGASTQELAPETPISRPKAAHNRERPPFPVAEPATSNSGLHVDDLQQIEVNRIANVQRQRVSGLTTRIRGHVSARGKRAQVARNQRKRT